jgi:pimeloyl-ACP methyl ester carboxylesterase
VNNTGPRLSCAPTTKARDEYMLTRLTPSAPLEEHWAQSLALGQFCTTLNENGSAKYAGTSAVVQDMMHFTELSAEAKGQKKEDALINYFGTSYGTLLGQTLAAMYPQRLGRIILDANVYGVDYYAGFVPSALDDTDHSFGFFFSFCYEAGEKLCPLAANATSAGDVETRYRALLQELENAPVVKQGSTGPGFVTRGDLESYAFNAMYSPKQGFLSLAAVVVELEKGNSTIFELLTATPQFDNAGIESLLLITSIDTAGRYVLKNYTDFLGAVTELQQNSFYAWKTYAVSNTVAVNAMEIIPPKSQLFPGFQQTNTSNPILFVATTGDPITPLSSAFKMSAYFEGSRVLTQDTPGHSFLGMATKCTVGHVQAYLANGTMPEVGTICETDVKTKEIATQLFTLPEAPAARMMMERRKFF